MDTLGASVWVCVCLLLLGQVSCDDYFIDDSGNRPYDTTGHLLREMISKLDRIISIDGRLDNLDQTVSSFNQRFSDLDRRISSLEERFHDRLTSLDQRVEDVHHTVSTLTGRQSVGSQQVYEDLRAVCAVLNYNPNVTTSATPIDVTVPATDVTSTQAVEPGTPFTVTRVTKTETDEAYLVKVEYLSSVTPTGVFLRSDFSAPEIPVEVEQPWGRVEVEVAKALNTTNALITFILPDKFVGLYLDLGTNHTTMAVPRVTLDFLQGDDVTFASGHDVTLNYTFKVDGDPSALNHDGVSMSLLVRSATEDAVVERYTPRGPQAGAPISVRPLEDVGEKGDRRGAVVISSNGTDVEGIMDAMVFLDFNCSNNCLVKYLYTPHRLNFYRQDHEGPFPPDFLGFVRRDRDIHPGTFFCAVSERYCQVFCQAVGSGPADVTLSRITPSGDVIALESAQTTQSNGGYAEVVIEDVTPEDAGVYLCEARAVTGEVIRQNVMVEVFEAPVVDEELSTVTVHENKSLTATCVARGRPAPNVTFSDISYYLESSDYDVSMTRVDESTTRGDLVIPDPAKARDVHGVMCEASNTGDMGQFYSHFDVHHHMVVPPEQ